MQYGFYLPEGGPLARPDAISTLATEAEAMAFDILAVADHVVMPRRIESTYPYMDDGEYTGGTDCLETLSTLSFVAAVTTRARLLSSVMVLPYRAPVFTAKMLASIDVLSGGRLIVGCGVGWMKEEFEALQSPAYAERGAVSDEYIEVFKTLWTQDHPSFDGTYCRFSEVDFLPKPVQKPHPPIWIGGESAPALRRTARVGDAWYPISTNPKFPVGTVAQLNRSMERIREHARGLGRDPTEIGLAFNPTYYNAKETERDASGARVPFTGNPQQVADDIKAFEEAGVEHLLLGLAGETLDEWRASLAIFTEKVRPLAG